MFKRHFAILLTIIGGAQLLCAQATPDVLTKSVRAIGYQVGAGQTKVDIKGTPLMPQASGKAEVQARPGYTDVEAEFKQLGNATKFGSEFLTYVLWAVSPEGRAANLGEVLLDKEGSGKLKVSTPLQTFSLVVTAEPYFAVRMPSELVVMENEIRKDTKGKLFTIEKYSLLKKARYQKLDNPLSLTLDLKSQPLDLYEARNAVAIAKSNAAETYAPEIYKKAEASLQMAENALKSRADRKQVVSQSRQAVQFSQDALTLALEREEAERLAMEKKAREDAEKQARQEAEAEAARRAKAEADRIQAEAQKAQADAQRAQAEIEKAKAEAARVRAESERAQAEASRAQAEASRAKAEAERLRAEAAQRDADHQKQQALAAEQQAIAAKQEADRLRDQAEADKAALRAKLLEQFRAVLETRDTDRGLVINMGDVLFDSGKYTLRPLAREKLARIAGIVMNYPELKIESEGHTDNIGSEEFNQKLSEQRASEVRTYLMSQGLKENAITSAGRGFSIPVASNDSAAGRQQNRRVELIVSGAIIGTAVGDLK
jgi:outer membrane protein OmpA-like peptidoglycan-associated protein